uniref:Cytochrome P450 n=1 Tax=Heterorhabditis bacteriophora TaxID=37862 RepID=A0A1I7X054_HETBA
MLLGYRFALVTGRVYLCEGIPLPVKELLRSFPSDEFATRTVEKWRTPLFLNGTDPSLVIPLRMSYTTRPTQLLSR